ncbi:MAG: PQQ-dependent sugar dehydrogenase [Verrucomicrobia bacterium]|nr:PQQ-dependent sugar dehydrogenase [Verrucomicrobiota bacterium]
MNKWIRLWLVCCFPLIADGQLRIGTGQISGIYQEHCAVCHGRDLRGGLGGPLVGQMPNKLTDEALARWIRDGNVDANMPAFKDILSEQEIRALVIYIREHQQMQTASQRTQTEPSGRGFVMETVVGGLSTPWGMAFLPDGSFLVTERSGNLRHFVEGELRSPVRGVPKAWASGQGGLLDVALHPDFASNGWIYLGLSQSDWKGSGGTAIARGRIRDNTWVDHEWIFQTPPEHRTRRSFHFGTRIILKDGFLFFAIGDRGEQASAQDLSSPNGRVHRLHDDGRVPEDNPFRNTEGAFPSSWTLGNRNIQGMDVDPVTGQLWAAEHGPRGGDELNLIAPGLNYGWPVITHGMNYDGTPITEKTEAEGMEQPKLYWTPSIAVCGIHFYTGSLFPEWRNHLFAAGLASEQLHRLKIVNNEVVEEEVVLRGEGRIRAIATGPEGAIYLVLNTPDRIVRLVPAP